MALFLVQHGKSLPKDKDPDQGLSKAGIAETKAMAAAALENNIQVKRIIHSGKKRALQTAEIFMQTLDPDAGISKGASLAPLDDVTIFAATLHNDENIMVVGHLPFMERLAAFLVNGNPERRLINFQNSGVICLDREEETDSWYIRWVLYPRFD